MKSRLLQQCFMIIRVITLIAVVFITYSATHDAIRHQQPYNRNIVISTNQYHYGIGRTSVCVSAYVPTYRLKHHHHQQQQLTRVSQRQHRIQRIYSQSSLGRLRYYGPIQVWSSSAPISLSSSTLSSTVTSSPPPTSTTTNVSSDDMIVTTTSNNRTTSNFGNDNVTFNRTRDTISNKTSMSTSIEIRNQLLTLLSTMKGNDNELRQVEEYINYLEKHYIPCQTISFLNLMMNHSTWQFIFSTNIIKRSSNIHKKFRLREVKQSIQCSSDNINSMYGTMINTCIWEYNQRYNNNDDNINNNNIFDCYGTFSIIGNYTITSSGRLVYNTTEPERIIQLLPKSTIPNNITQLMYYIQTNLCYELFDPTFHSYDITYMDDQIRIIRYTGIRYEGIRNIFIRK